MEKIIMHIDVNNAFLSWTALELLNKGYKYDIRNSYAVIGGDPKMRKGIVLAKSNAAKKMGVVTAETLYSAKRKCPALKVYEPNYKVYSDMSKKLFDVLSKYSPDIEVASIDECYLDYSKVKNLYGEEIEFAYKLKGEIKQTLGFTVNVGIANNKLCAKMASDFSKPDKVHTLYDFEIKEKLHPLAVGELFGIGRKTVPKLLNIGIKTIGDLANTDDHFLRKYFKNQALVLIDMANGIDNSIVVSEEYIPDSIGNEITLSADVIEKAELYKHLMALSENVSIRLRNQKKYVTVICVVLKNNYFKRKSHQRKLKNSTNITNEIYKISKEVLDEMYDGEPIRLIGLRLEKLVESKDYQTNLFEDVDIRDNSNKVDEVLDELKIKYGNGVITKASLIENKTMDHLNSKWEK